MARGFAQEDQDFSPIAVSGTHRWAGGLVAAPDERARPTGTATFSNLHFSPDSNRIAFIRDVDGVPQVWVKSLVGGEPLQITFGEPASRPRWSPKGDQILYVLLTAPNTPEGFPSGDLWLVSPEGGVARKLITDGVNPNWSWDGEHYVTWASGGAQYGCWK